ncbi:MAG: hypothetical protein KJZ72_17570 [Anaerolineales bacterium]|nr:hypothetical protein [Anaerolineales bacterium]
MNKNPSFIFKYVLMFCFLLSACAPATPLGNELGTATVTPRLTDTAQPTFTKTATPIPPQIPDKYEFPTWVSDPNNQVFAMVTDVLKDSNQLTFINANTHEKYVINVPSTDISHYFWTPEGKSLGFIKSNFASVYLVDLATGKVSESNIPESFTQCIDERQREKFPILRYFSVESSSPSDTSFFCPPPVFNFSQEEKDGKHITFLENPTTGQKVQLSSNNGSDISYRYELSPSFDKIAILQGSSPDPDLIHPMGTSISIYSLPEGKLVSTFDGKFCSMKWSPDGDKLLTTQSDENACNSNSVPVILYPSSGRSQRITAIENAQHSKYSISTFNWSQDSNFLYYTYVNPDRSDVCRYDLKKDDIFCPTSSFNELNERNVEYYKFSPDEKFLTVLYGDSCAGCDYWGDPSSVLMNIDGSDMLFLGKEIYRSEVNSPYPYNTLVWRPLPNR